LLFIRNLLNYGVLVAVQPSGKDWPAFWYVQKADSIRHLKNEMIRDLKTEVEKVIEPILTQEDFDLIEVKLSRYKRNYRLQIFVDCNRGVLLDECARLSKLIGSALEITDIFDTGYILEVSSPGLDRPLRTGQDFKRKIGKDVDINLIEDGQEKSISGMLTGLENGVLLLSSNKGTVKIALADIVQGKVKI
jgi:ribosome maturation factor RimP